MTIEAEKLRTLRRALPTIDYSLNKLDWNRVAEEKSKPLSEKAKQLKQEARQAMMSEYAPQIMLQEMLKGKPEKPKLEPIQGLDPAVARGVVAAVKGGITHEAWLELSKWYERVAATAKGDRYGP